MTEIEKMPRVNWEAIQAFNPGPDLQEVDAILVAEAQRKADMEWANKRINEAADVGVAALWEMFNYGYERGKAELIEQGYVRLPSLEEIKKHLNTWQWDEANCGHWTDTGDCLGELYRYLKEGK